MKSMYSLCLVLTIALALGLAQLAPGSAQNMMASAPVDCSKADSMMMHPNTSMQSMQSMKPTGNVDQDFAQMMMMHNSAMMAMAKTEVACGKDPKAKAMAQKALDQATADDQALHDLIQNIQRGP